jgi:hypothetical protein
MQLAETLPASEPLLAICLFAICLFAAFADGEKSD